MSDETTIDPGSINVAEIDPQEFARNVGQASDQDLSAVMSSEARDLALGEIFRRMEEHFRAEAAGDTEAVIHWKIGGRPGGGEDHWEVVIAEGKVETSNEPSREPRVTLKMGGPEFLKLVSGTQSGPAMFMTGKLKIDGDLLFAARVPGLFDIPSG